MIRIESFLAARLFLVPQLVGNRIFFISNLNGRNSLYVMDEGGSVPEPLLPPHIALQNPILMQGSSFVVFPQIGKILVMIDNDGDENYQPMVIPIDGGYPEPAFGDFFNDYRVHCIEDDLDHNIVYLWAESRQTPFSSAFRANLETADFTKLGTSKYACLPVGHNKAHTKAVLIDAYSTGDHVVYIKEESQEERQLLYGVPLSERQEGQQVKPNSIFDVHFVNDDNALLVATSLFSDTFGLGIMALDNPSDVQPVSISGTVHEGTGEFTGLQHLHDDRYLFSYNIDGCDWLYEGRFNLATRSVRLDHVLCGQGMLANGVVKGHRYDKATDCHVLSFTTATTPTQLYTIAGEKRDQVTRHTHERVLGIPEAWLALGEDASFTSFDGLRVSARLYLPHASLGFEGPRPLVYYIHGGPQSQEHPDFAWFSMPLIQFLTLNGFAVFVPNVRGSTGYGFAYMEHVIRDWGGQDRLDHVHAMTAVLPQDERIDTGRAAVVGRSYGGFMTLTLASRHPQLWSAAVDMFGPYDLPTFASRIPETWKPMMAFLVGDPVKDKDFLIERSPRTYIDQITCPLLVIQGKNDPRVVEQESRELVEHLRQAGKTVDYLMFADEGHDVLKFDNRVRCYNAITDFFKTHLRP